MCWLYGKKIMMNGFSDFLQAVLWDTPVDREKLLNTQHYIVYYTCLLAVDSVITASENNGQRLCCLLHVYPKLISNAFIHKVVTF